MAKAVHTQIRKTELIERLVLNKFFWFGLVAFFFLTPILRSMKRELPPELPVLNVVPEFRAVDENGKPFTTKTLNGRPYIASFFFTSCPTVCPKLTEDLKVVQKRIRGVANKMLILTFTVDPETDTSKVLFKKARELKANPHVWKFLTTDKTQEFEKLLVAGFQVPMGEKTADSVYDIAHSQKLVLVDGKNQIRGYYSTDKEGMNRMMIDIGLLLNRSLYNK